MSRYKYYVNGVLQRLIPQKPNESTTLKITKTASIGAKDTISTVSTVKVHKDKVVTP